MFWLKENKKNLSFLALLVLLSMPSLIGLLLPGFFQSDDGEWMVIRFSAFYQALSDGQIPVRLLGRLNFGYGYPVANFLYPGFMYLAVPFQVLGMGFVTSIKIILIGSVLAGGIFSFLWLSKLYDRVSSLSGALLYTYFPYHLFDIYKRGSVGEVLSLGVLPFIFWQIERRGMFWMSLGIALLILAHNTLAILFLPLIVVYTFVKSNLSITYFIKIFFKPLALGVGMSSFFWIPAFYELRYTNFSKTEISNWSSYFSDISLISMPVTVLLITFILIVLKKIDLKKNKIILIFILFGLISTFFASNLSQVFWNYLPSFLVQFPFRLLSIALPASALLIAASLSLVEKKYKMYLAVGVGAVVFILSLPFLFPEKRNFNQDSYYSTNEASTTVKDEYMPYWVKNKPVTRFENKVEASDSLISNLAFNSKKVTFDAFSGETTRVRVNTIYYPGWEAMVNGKKTKVYYDNPNGVIEIEVPKGKSSVSLSFKETPTRLFADLLSLTSFVLLVLLNKSVLIKYLKR